MNVTKTIIIRPANISDAEVIAEIICDLAEKFILSSFDKAAKQIFLESNNAHQINHNINNGYYYLVAVNSGKIIGLIGMKGYNHLYHLFVLEQYQGMDLSRQLWEKARDYCIENGNPGLFTVNSSTNAVQVYKAFGFKKSAATQQKMELLLIR